ncbi:MAG: PRC-barrel domain-containing protein [Gaiellaceae bacterium]
MLPLLRTSGLVRRPVEYRGIRLGAVADALFDRPIRRLVGLEIRCGDDKDRLLPFPACEVRDDSVTVESALVLLEGNLEFYRLDGCTFSELRATPVRVDGDEAGPLTDLLVTPDGEVARIVAAAPDGRLELEPGGAVTMGNQGLRPAV